jgi:hypothetical protein
MAAAGVTLDSGALIAFGRGRRHVVALIERAAVNQLEIAVPAGVVAQVWRDGPRQARLARLLASPAVHVVPLDDAAARAVGQLLGVSATADVVDASVAWCARQRAHVVVTSDPDDIAALAPGLQVVVC